MSFPRRRFLQMAAGGLAMLALGLFPGPLLQLCYHAIKGLG